MLRGQVTKESDARVALLMDFGGALKTVEYLFGTGAEEAVEVDATSRHELHPGQRITLTLLLAAEGRNAAARLSVDSVDAEIVVLDPVPSEDAAS